MPESSVKYQYLAAFVVNILTLGYGVSGGWSSPNLLLITSDESPLPSGKATMEEASWITSLLCIGGLIGNIFFGFITNAFGRKIPLIIISIPAIAGWMLILYAQNVYYLYAARIVNGFVGGGVFVIVPIFLSEIASDSVRGVLGSTLVLVSNIGMLIAFVFGSYFEYDKTPKFIIGMTILSAVLLYFFPESPSYLIKKGNVSVQETEKSIKFYQNMSGIANYETIQSEVEKLRASIEGTKTDKLKENSFDWSELFFGPGRKAMTIGIVLASINQFSGCFAMLNYTAKIFQEAGSSMSPNNSAIVVGIVQIFGAIAATLLVDRAGRKFLFTASSVGTALGLSTLGAYSMFKSWGYNVEPYNWIPVVSFSWVIFIASWALLTLTFLVISEIMPEQIKEFGISFCVALLWTLSFMMIKLLPLFTELLGFHGIMFIFAGCCIANAVFVMLYMPETKGRSYEQIMESL